MSVQLHLNSVVAEAAPGTLLFPHGEHVVAINCGTVMVHPDAGLPVIENLKAVYKQLSADRAKHVAEVLAAGIIGSCCRSTSDHVRASRRVVQEFNRTK